MLQYWLHRRIHGASPVLNTGKFCGQKSLLLEYGAQSREMGGC